MAISALPTEQTTFTKDVLGRYVFNRLDEAACGEFAPDEARPATRPDARPFDVIVLGGGSFGPILAQHLFAADDTRSRRVLVLEAGRFTLPEHQQNLPIIGDPGVWELPWQPKITNGFKGLAVMVGGRSVLWGGWSPRLLDANGNTEMPRDAWPEHLVGELTDANGYFDQAAAQIGSDQTNDFIFGELHEVLRSRLAVAIDSGDIPNAIPLDDLDLQIIPPAGTTTSILRELRLEAPLAVRSSSPRSGAFTQNKFSAVPLLIKAARAAQEEVVGLLGDWTKDGASASDDAKKRLMAIPDFRITRLETEPIGNGRVRVTRVLGLQDGHIPVDVPVGENAVVVIALATIESARLAMLSFPSVPTRPLMGQNLMAHLRSNIVMRIERSALPSGLANELQASALFLKGSHTYDDGSGKGYFHLQITAAGLTDRTKDDHDELFMAIPDIDGFENFLEADDDHVVITIRGIGEMTRGNTVSGVRLINDQYFGAQKAEAQITSSSNDNELWTAMDETSNAVARALANAGVFEVRRADGSWVDVTQTTDLSANDILPYTFRDAAPKGRRDQLGTTHHEAGTLRFGESSGDSVTDLNARFHDVQNAYVAGPALFPTIGSPNPMLTGTAFARRLADHLVATMPRHIPQADPGFQLLFDGKSFGHWKQSRIHNIDNLEYGKDNPGRFIIMDGTLESTRGTGLGMLWYSEPLAQNYVLKLEWLRFRIHDNSGILLRFPNPTKQHYRNEAWVGTNFGFEVQIDEHDPMDIRRTGAIYDQIDQNLSLKAARSAGEWNDFEIRVEKNTYTVLLNGSQVTQFKNKNPARGRLDYPFFGLQSHFDSRVSFRNIQYKAI